jgi:hypothetical protein
MFDIDERSIWIGLTASITAPHYDLFCCTRVKSEFLLSPGSLLVATWSNYALIEDPNPHGMVSTSTPNICKRFDNLLILWMGIWIYHHVVTTSTLVSHYDLVW